MCPDQPIITLEDAPQGSVVAPAGYGKTQAIVDLVSLLRAKPTLVLTHTNAGVGVLRQRLNHKKIPPSAYRLHTIDAWSQHIVRAFPTRAGYDFDPNGTIEYDLIKEAVIRVMTSGGLDMPLKSTYGAVLVDEYQDCDLNQHKLIAALAQQLPARVFGDPMQAIFDFAAFVVPWTDVEATFSPLAPMTIPERWNRAGCAALGRWLDSARGLLASGASLDFSTAPPEAHVRWIPRGLRDPVIEESEALRAVKCPTHARLLVIGNSAQAVPRQEFARRHPWIGVVERADLPDLADFSSRLASAPDSDRLDVLLSFAESVMTNTEAAKLKRRIETLRRGRALKPATLYEGAAIAFVTAPSPANARQVLSTLASKQDSKMFRRELLDAMLEALAAARHFSELLERVAAVRNRRRFGSRVVPRRAIGSTLLLKGLEAEHVLILDAAGLSCRHLYVAITRGTRSLTIMSGNPTYDVA